MGKQLSEGTHGGIAILDKDDRVERDLEAEERAENRNVRTADQLSTALETVLRYTPGPYISNRLFRRNLEYSQNDDIEYDRFYFELNLLVQFYPAPLNNAERDTTRESNDDHRNYAKANGFRYLGIVGQADGNDLIAAMK